MVLGTDMMHFLAEILFPFLVTISTCDPWSFIEATGEERWIELGPIILASSLAIDCAPTGWLG
jgi:hypothetical protein